MERTLDRTGLWAVQTPQAFRADALREALSDPDSLPDATDDAMLVERHGGRVLIHATSPDNLKVTTPLDLRVAELLLRERGIGSQRMETRRQAGAGANGAHRRGARRRLRRHRDEPDLHDPDRLRPERPAPDPGDRRDSVYGVVSLIFWAVTLIVTVKYVGSSCAPTTRARAGSWR